MNGFGAMKLVREETYLGHLYRCPCGVEVWTHFGRARQHLAECPQAQLTTALEPTPRGGDAEQPRP